MSFPETIWTTIRRCMPKPEMNTLISHIALKMTRISQGNLHDINHFMKVWAFARIIGEKELTDPTGLAVLEAAAILHDIACPLCREKYGSTLPDKQELEGMPLAEEFLREFELPGDFVERVVWLVGHHHTLCGVESMEHRILLEADYLVNACEAAHSDAAIRSAEKNLFRTQTGLELLRDMYITRLA